MKKQCLRWARAGAALLLAVLMCLWMVPVQVYAAPDGTPEGGTAVTEAGDAGTVGENVAGSRFRIAVRNGAGGDEQALLCRFRSGYRCQLGGSDYFAADAEWDLGWLEMDDQYSRPESIRFSFSEDADHLVLVTTKDYGLVNYYTLGKGEHMIEVTDDAARVFFSLRKGEPFRPTGTGMDPVAQTPLTGRKLSVLGDSISAYYGYLPYEPGAYYPRESEPFGASSMWWAVLARNTGMEICKINAISGSGITVPAYAPQLTANSDRCKDLSGRDGTGPDEIIVLISGNDFLQGINKANENKENLSAAVPRILSDIKPHYLEMLDKIKKEYPDASIHVGTYFPCRTLTSAFLTPLNNMIREMAETARVDLIDLEDCGFTESEYNEYMIDGWLHPNERGQIKLGERAAREMLAGVQDPQPGTGTESLTAVPGGKVVSVLLDADNNNEVLRPNSNGVYNLTQGKNYVMQLEFSGERGIASGLYHFDFPLCLDEVSSGRTDMYIGDVRVGEWYFSEDGSGRIYFDLNEEINNYAPVTLNASVSFSLKETVGEIDFGDNTVSVNVIPDGDGMIQLDKGSWGTPEWDQESKVLRINWVVWVRSDRGAVLTGDLVDKLTPTNAATGQYNGEYTDADKDDGLRIFVYDENGKPYKDFKVSRDEIEWVADGTGKTRGWRYEMPSGYDGTPYTFEIHYTSTYTGPGAEEGKIGEACRNSVEFRDLEAVGKVLPSGNGNYAVVTKAGEYIENEESPSSRTEWTDMIRWTVDVNLAPFHEPENADAIKYSIVDDMLVQPVGDKRVVAYKHSVDLEASGDYPAIAVPSADNNVSFKVQAQILDPNVEDPVFVDVPNIADTLSNEYDSPFAYQISESKDMERMIYFYTKADYCHGNGCPNCTFNQWIGKNICKYQVWAKDGVPTDYCQCWRSPYSVNFRITYDTPMQELQDWESENGKVVKIRNYVQSFMQDLGGARKIYQHDEHLADVGVPEVFSKTMKQEPNKTNGYKAEYSIMLNDGLMDLGKQGGDITIKDKMSETLVFNPMSPGSLTIERLDESGRKTELVQNRDYDFIYDEAGHELTVTLHSGILGRYRYEMGYTLDFMPAEALGETIKTYSNDAQVELFGNTFKSGVGEKVVPDIGIDGTRCAMTLKKVDGLDGKSGLKGAEFGLYAQDGTEIRTFSTGEDGTAAIKTDVKNGVILHANTVYYLLEKKAPEGYELSDRRYYFEFVAGDLGPGEDTKVENGISIRLVSPDNGEFEITNERIVTFNFPATGGTGTAAHVIMGSLLVMLAGSCLANKKKNGR